MPLPWSKTLHFPSIPEGVFCHIATNVPVSSSLQLSNLMLNKSVYAFIGDSQQADLLIKSNEPYLVYSSQNVPYEMGTNSQSFTLKPYEATCVTFTQPMVLDIQCDGAFRIIDSDSEIVFEDELDGKLTIDYQGPWLAFENLDSKGVTVEVYKNVNA